MDRQRDEFVDIQTDGQTDQAGCLYDRSAVLSTKFEVRGSSQEKTNENASLLFSEFQIEDIHQKLSNFKKQKFSFFFEKKIVPTAT